MQSTQIPIPQPYQHSRRQNVTPALLVAPAMQASFGVSRHFITLSPPGDLHDFSEIRSPREVDMLGYFEDEPLPGGGLNTLSLGSHGLNPRFSVEQGITAPYESLGRGSFGTIYGPNIEAFGRSTSVGHNSFEFSPLGLTPIIQYDCQRLDEPSLEYAQPWDLDRLVPDGRARSYGTSSSAETCPSLTHHSWSSVSPEILPSSGMRLHSNGSFAAQVDSDVLSFQLSDIALGSHPEASADDQYSASNSDMHNASSGPGIRGLYNHLTSSTYTNEMRGTPQQMHDVRLNDAPYNFDLTRSFYAHDNMQQFQPERPEASQSALDDLINDDQSHLGDYGSVLSPNSVPEWICFGVESGANRHSMSDLPRRKGSRYGHLPVEKAQTIAKRRKERKTCMRCRTMRTECDGGDPCQRCIRAAESMTLMHPCIKAHFFDIIESGTCNYISQRAINHPTLDRSRRVQMFLAKTFNVDHLLDSLASRRQSFNIRARQASDSLYVLDLARCHNFLKGVRRSLVSTKNDDLRSFIDDTLVNTSGWYDCVQECNPAKDREVLLSKWNIMPSRASYEIVSLQRDVPDRPLDPEDADDRKEILIAAQVSRIICRKLEIDGYRSLQSTINNARTQTAAERLKFAHSLGIILTSLRWRMSWWELLGDGSKEYDPFRDQFVERVKILSRVLYFYYFYMRKNIGSYYDLGSLQGVRSTYPDAEVVFDDFPTMNSVDGFEAWLHKGKELIRLANVQQKFRK